jgi:hypothetical protein
MVALKVELVQVKLDTVVDLQDSLLQMHFTIQLITSPLSNQMLS